MVEHGTEEVEARVEGVALDREDEAEHLIQDQVWESEVARVKAGVSACKVRAGWELT